jgi:hypothetical protein
MIKEISLLIVSMGLMGLGIYLWQKSSYLLSVGKIAQAVILKNIYRPNGNNGNGLHYPVVRFLTDKQVWITEELNVGYSPAKKEGTKLEVRYDPEDPSNVLIDSKLELEVLPRLLVGIGVFALILLLLELLEITQILS